MGANQHYCASDGFTLIELAIVLVIIGLVVGGVLVGQDLVRAAGVRATISQIEKFNTAANTFYGKYGALPGDLNGRVANTFGFTPRGTGISQGDGNGIIQGASGYGFNEATGETLMFWVDLTTANGLNVNMIEGSFSAATISGSVVITNSSLGNYFPPAKLGRGNYIYVWSKSGPSGFTIPGLSGNYLGFSAVSGVPASTGGCNGCVVSNPSLTVQEAASIDAKVDDGLPQSGNVLALYLNASLASSSGDSWAAGGGTAGASSANGPTTSATPGSSTTCYDNGNVAGASQQYSVEISNGSNVNCALSFKLQAGD